MKDFLVRMVRTEEIRIRADDAKDAAAIATQFPMSCWEDEFKLFVEAAETKACQSGETLKIPTKASKKRKKNRRWKCRCDDHCADADIPF